MANIGLPNTLSTMLQQLVSNNNLISWNIFENKNGKISCNIQFDIPDIVCDSEQPTMHDYTCAYRRISPKQQTRNANRVLQYAKRRKLNPTITAEPSTTPEQNRTETIESPSNHVDTPSSVHPVHTPSSVHHMDTVPWILETPDTHAKAKITPPSPPHMSPSTLLLSPPLPIKTFTSITTQTESTEPITITTLGKTDCDELGASLKADSDHPDNLEYNIENQKKSPVSVDVICQNEQSIESVPSSGSLNLHPNTTKIPPKFKPPDPPNPTDPYASYTRDGYEYYYVTYEGRHEEYEGMRYLTRRKLSK